MMDHGFAERLKALRARRNFTVTELATVSGVQRETITRLESAERNPRWDVAIRLARALAVKLDDFVGDREAANAA